MLWAFFLTYYLCKDYFLKILHYNWYIFFLWLTPKSHYNWKLLWKLLYSWSFKLPRPLESPCFVGSAMQYYLAIWYWNSIDWLLFTSKLSFWSLYDYRGIYFSKYLHSWHRIQYQKIHWDIGKCIFFVNVP